jgi:hypothetical protein
MVSVLLLWRSCGLPCAEGTGAGPGMLAHTLARHEFVLPC